MVKVEVRDDDLVDVVGGEPLGRQGLLDGNHLRDGIIVEHILGVYLGKILAVAGVIQNIPQGGVLNQQRHCGGLYHGVLVLPIHQAELGKLHLPQVQHTDFHAHVALSFVSCDPTSIR